MGRVVDLFIKRLADKASESLPDHIYEALRKYIISNDRDALVGVVDDIKSLLQKPSLKPILKPTGKYVYRFIDVPDQSVLRKITREQEAVMDGFYRKGPAGVLYPKDGGDIGLSSWTEHPRSLIYSGFLSSIPPKNGLILFRARPDNQNNLFFGNPEMLYKSLELGLGHALQREVFGVGPVHYDRIVTGARRPQQSIEGLAADLTNLMLKVDGGVKPDDYYIPDYEAEVPSL